MLNQTGITTVAGTSRNQILANVDIQASVGCVVAQAVGVEDEKTKRKIAKAGTPLKLEYSNLTTPATKADAENEMTAILLHDVDVTDGNANGTALILGIVNLNRVDQDVQTMITTALTNEAAKPRPIIFVKQ